MSEYCEGEEDCKCRFTRDELMELLKISKIKNFKCPSCKHTFGVHPSKATSSSTVSPSPTKSPGSAKEGRDYGSFRKKVLRREGYDPADLPPTIDCQICGEEQVSTTIQAAHILDLNQRDLLFEQYGTDPEHFPVSINDVDNGFLVCAACHKLFDDPEKHISLKPDGSLKFSKTALQTKKYKTLLKNKAQVTFSEKIGDKDYPSAEFIKWAANQNKGERKKSVKRKLAFTNEEPDDEDAPKKKKTRKTTRKSSKKKK